MSSIAIMSPSEISPSETTVAGVLDSVNRHVRTYLKGPDVLPVTVAIADPKKIKIGVTIQREYPLTLIQRGYGIPFGKLRTDPTKFISNPDELHGCKWSLDVHEAVFQVDTLNEEFILGRNAGEQRVEIALSVGVGNILQNLRSIGYEHGRKPHHVIGERLDTAVPYSCLVAYAPESDGVGVELLLFNQDGGCSRINKARYLETNGGASAIKQPDRGFESKIRWAVSGYPIVLNASKVRTEFLAYNISDYRHIWRLPKLKKSLIDHLAGIAGIRDPGSTLDFYFGFRELHEDTRFVQATHGEPVEFPLTLTLQAEQLETMCSICGMDVTRFHGLNLVHEENEIVRIRLDPDELQDDFLASGYIPRETESLVLNSGDFFIGRDSRKVVVKLHPAVYPHHIIGISAGGNLVNISIGGLGGRTGVTLQGAAELSLECGLTDALILDNGFDVITRIGGGAIIAHRKNVRQTRLTAALHFGYLLASNSHGGCPEGLDLAIGTCSLLPA